MSYPSRNPEQLSDAEYADLLGPDPEEGTMSLNERMAELNEEEGRLMSLMNLIDKQDDPELLALRAEHVKVMDQMEDLRERRGW